MGVLLKICIQVSTRFKIVILKTTLYAKNALIANSIGTKFSTFPNFPGFFLVFQKNIKIPGFFQALIFVFQIPGFFQFSRMSGNHVYFKSVTVKYIFDGKKQSSCKYRYSMFRIFRLQYTMLQCPKADRMYSLKPIKMIYKLCRFTCSS